MAQAASYAERVGQTIAGRYRVEELLGQGGMAVVYRVLDTSSAVPRALKCVRATSPAAAARRAQLLEREYYTLAQLAHPRIIAVYDFGRDEAGPFYTMELLDGADLASLGKVDWQRACALLRDVASSLAVLHSRGLLHRDVSARNVRCGANGTAKLIDFGALCSMGLDLDVVGTPPFVAPEALQMQALDARADLFSLGAVGYHLLTGRHAYPARQLRDLRDVWRSTPLPIDRLAPEAPPALGQLIRELLSLDRGARPQSAAEIMKRLCTIARLPYHEEIAVSRAYLAAPALVGREAALITIRKQLLSLARGDGHAVLIEGPTGSGRSRMLDAAVLEGKLLGALVLRAHATDGTGADWSVVRTLIEQLMSWMHEHVDAAARLSRSVLSHVLDGLSAEGALGPMPERSLLIRELRDFVLKLCESHAVVFAVDDVDRIDEPSQAVLSALAHKTERHPLVIVATAQHGREAPKAASLSLLRSLATRIELQPLSAAQSEALLRSVFGNVPNLPFVAAHIQRLAQGMPRAIMELSEDLVQRGLCRYEEGCWSLPASLDEGALPASLAESLEGRLRDLSADARALIEAVCIADRPSLSAAQLAALSDGWPPERVFAATSELVAARVLVAEAEFFRLSQPGYVPVARALMSDGRRIALHGRMADLLRTSASDPIVLAHHLLEADRDEEAIRILRGVDTRTRHPPLWLLERALAHAERRGMSPRLIEDLRISLVGASVFGLDLQVFRRVAPPALARLVADSGLGLYAELHDLPAPERLGQALARTQQRYLDTPAAERVYSVEEAIRKLARLSNAYTIMTLWTFDATLLASIPDLGPLLPLSQAIGVVHQLNVAAELRNGGRLARARRAYEAVLARIAEPDGAGLEPEQCNLIRTLCLLLVGNMEAQAGMPRCEARAQELESDRAFRVAAWRMRQQYHLSCGDPDQARKAARRAELLQVQDGLDQQAHGGHQAVAVITYGRTEDLLGLDAALAEVQVLAERMPYWRPVLHYGQSARLRLRGDAQAALDALLPGLELAAPGVHWAYGVLCALHVQLLDELGRSDEAIALGRQYLAIVEREELTAAFDLRRVVALALARGGKLDEAWSTIEGWIEYLEAAGYAGVILGSAYEAAARIRLWSSDREGFERYYDRCSAVFGAANNRALSAKLARLRGEADPDQAPPADLDPGADGATMAAEDETIYSRILECVDSTDRARCALTMLLQQTERASGYWFAYVGDAALELRAALPETPDPDLVAWVDAWFCSELARRASGAANAVTESAVESEFTQSATVTPDPLAVLGVSADRQGRSFEAVLLTTRRAEVEVAVGVLVLQVERRLRISPNHGLIQQIAALMLGHGDVRAAVPQVAANE